MIDHIGTVFAEIEIEMLWLVEQDAIYDEDKIGQQCDWSYKSALYQK